MRCPLCTILLIFFGTLLLICCPANPAAAAQTNRNLSILTFYDHPRILVWLYLNDNARLAGLMAPYEINWRTQQRLQRNSKIVQSFEPELIPTEALVAQIRAQVLDLRHYSRSLKAFSALIDAEDYVRLQRLPYISRIEPVGICRKQLEVEDLNSLTKKAPTANNYPYYNQLAQLNIPRVHQMGLTGKGIRIGLLDTGFNQTHEALQKVISEKHLIAQYDFINRDKNVADEASVDSTKVGLQSTHGTAVWGLIAGYKPEVYIGAAYDAEFVLAKTEKIDSETHIEEDDYVAGVEWCDHWGVDIISTSLSYRDFDDFDYEYLDLDGKSTVVTRIVNWAFERGILFVTAAGNDALKYEDGGLSAPADAFGALTVGAVDNLGIIAYFSSYGPTADGRIKPDLCALGRFNYLIASGRNDGYYYASGTSFATPLIAGAAALVLQRFPNLTPAEIIARLKQFADRSQNPVVPYGWGIPDVYRSVTETLWVDYEGRSPNPTEIIAYPNPANEAVKLQFIWHRSLPVAEPAYLQIYNLRGEVIYERLLASDYFQKREIIEFPLRNVPNGIYFVQLKNKAYAKKGKFVVLH